MKRFPWAAMLLMVTASGWAAKQPVPVSPGSARSFAVVQAACPTFSWGGVAEARVHELVIYRVGEEGQIESEPVVRVRLPGTASSWTPPLEQCLERGQSYAWSIRAETRKRTSDWSSPSLFRLLAGPGEEEFQQALAVVGKYVAMWQEADVETGDEATRRADTGGEETTSLGRSQSGSTPQALGGADFSVDSSGNVQANSFSGDGFQLSRVNAETLQGLAPSVFLRNHSDSFDGGILTFKSGTTLDVNGTLRMDGTVVKTGTGVVTDFNADLLDGVDGSAYAKASDVPEIQGGSTTSASLCPTTTLTSFSASFSVVPAVVISPEGISGFPDSFVGDSYCVIFAIDTVGFRHCCYGNDPRELHWIAIGE